MLGPVAASTEVLVLLVLQVALIGYLGIAMVFGCPYCPYPDLAWPVTLVERLRARWAG